MNRPLIILIQALLFALIVNSPFIYQHIQCPEKANLLFSDIDEVTYLKLAYDTAAKKPLQAYYHENTSTFSWTNRGPTVFLNYVTGKMGVALNLSLSEFGLLLNILSAFPSYLSFYFLFSLYLKNSLHIATAISITLFFPWVLSPLWDLFPTDLLISWSIVGTTYGGHALPPIFRGISTQMSYPLVGSSLYFLMKYVTAENQKNRDLIICGIITGISLLFYFFAWGALMVVSILTLLLIRMHKYFHTKSLKEVTLAVSELFIFSVPLLLASAPALYLIFCGNSGGIADLSHLPKYWYLSLSSIYFLAITLIVGYFAPYNKKNSSLKTLLISLLLADIILRNLQPILASVIASYHFSVIYLQVLFLPFFLILILNIFIIRFHIKTKLVSKICLLILFFIPYKLFFIHTEINKSLSDYSILNKTLSMISETTPADSVIAALPYSEAFSKFVPEQFSIRILPNLIYTMTDRHTLLQEWCMSRDIRELYDQRLRERLLHYILTKGDGFILPVIYTSPKLPGDLFNLTWTAYLINRFNVFNAFPDLQEIPSLNIIKQKYRVDYLLVDKKDPVPILKDKPENYIEVFNNSSYILFKIKNYHIPHVM
jgi:hypothetical protein